MSQERRCAQRAVVTTGEKRDTENWLTIGSWTGQILHCHLNTVHQFIADIQYLINRPFGGAAG